MRNRCKKMSGTHGLDEWRKEELLALPMPWWDAVAAIFTKVEQGKELEDTLVDVFNSFIDLRATGLGGAGRADVEIVYDKKEKFASDAKATGKKLTQIKTRRLNAHRKKIGAKYTIIVTPEYTPSVLEDIRYTPNYIIKADTLAEYLRQHFDNGIRDISWKEFDKILGSKRSGRDISKDIHQLTISKFGTKTKWY